LFLSPLKEHPKMAIFGLQKKGNRVKEIKREGGKGVKIISVPKLETLNFERETFRCFYR
jgi:hypothetical protein